METTYKPYFDPEFEHLIERIHPPRVSIHNDTCRDCTLVKVDSVNKNGILLEMVQVLTDLDLVISKSYICSDGGWFMDVFHVTDQLGNKVTDDSLIFYIQQALCANRRASSEVQTTSIHKDVRPRHISTDQTALEMTGTDRPGLMSEIAAVLAEMGCNVSSAVAWTHNGRVACIIYVEDEIRRGPIVDPCRVAQVQAQLENVVEAHHSDGERRSVRLAAPAAGRTHTERRLHQLLAADGDYEECCCGGCGGGSGGGADGNKWRQGRSGKWCDGTHVTVEYCKEKGYSIVTVRSRDRPKLLFDTVCTLTDMQYVVFHAAISSQGAAAVQEYYVRKKDGCTLDSDKERQRVIQCLIAATERRISHGLRLDVCSRNRLGLLSDITRVLRENGLSIKRAEIGTHGERAVGSFYVTDASGHKVNAETVEAIRKETAGSVLVVNERLGHAPPNPTGINSRKKDNNEEGKPRFSLGSLLWSHVERLSSNFKPIKS